MTNPATLNELLVDVTESYVLWQGGKHSAWTCDGIVGNDFLEDLLQLAAYAPRGKIEAFVNKYKETE